jgi:hypothetical protein
VGTVLLERPVTRADLVLLATVAPGLAAADLVAESPVAAERAAAVVVPVATDSVSSHDLRRLLDAGDQNGWLLFTPPRCVCELPDGSGGEGVMLDAATAAIEADAAADVVALVGTAIPSFVPDNRVGRWGLKAVLAEPSPADPPPIALARLAASRCAVIRAPAALRVWPDTRSSTTPLLLAVARLVANGERVRVSPGLSLPVPGWRGADAVFAAIAAARQIGGLERVFGRQLVRTEDGRPSGFLDEERSSPVPTEIAVVMALVRVASRLLPPRC